MLFRSRVRLVSVTLWHLAASHIKAGGCVLIAVNTHAGGTNHVKSNVHPLSFSLCLFLSNNSLEL